MDLPVNRKYIYIRWFLLRLGLILFDIFAVNAAYYLALVVRFYVNFEFNEWAVKYIPAFFQFAPAYTVCCLTVFAALGLYNSLWKYASVHDLNRILLTSVITCVFHVCGTLLFVMRMPITYYALGAVFQFVLITISRFSYRLIIIEKDKFFKQNKQGGLNVMVVGVSESSRTVIKYLERDSVNAAHPVCVIDCSDSELPGTMAGVPVIGGVDKIKSAVRKYQVDQILLADSIMPADMRKTVRDIGREIAIPVQNFSGYFQSVPSRIPLRCLLDYVEGPVEIEFNGVVQLFSDAAQAVFDSEDYYIVASVQAESDVLRIKLIQDVLLPNDTQADWVQDYQKETGENISFF